MPGETESAEVTERESGEVLERTDAVPPPRERQGESPPPGEPPPPLARPLRAGLGAAVALCVTASVLHVLLVFLQVAPANPVSQQFSRAVNAWVFPLFEQNWKLFAPDPESVNRQIFARAASTAADGTVRVSAWYDLTAEDDAEVAHNPFPSHTAQNMLRRSWSSYLDTHGGDDEPHSDRAVMMQRYLRNIAVQRVAARRPGAIESIQLRVVTLPIPASGGSPTPTAQTRLLPWWKVTSHAN